MKPFAFIASDGWVQRFRGRLGIHSVRTYGEKGSSDEVEADEFVVAARKELIECGFSPNKDIEIILNINEIELVYKSVPKI